jgi:hypothetical protein
LYTEENPLIKEEIIILDVSVGFSELKDKFIKKIKKRWFTVKGLMFRGFNITFKKSENNQRT